MAAIECLNTGLIYQGGYGLERFIAIDNVCAWPNLTLLPDGTILATIFNQPTHGKWEGDVECWTSEDGGHLWKRRGVPAPHEPGTNRMNVSAGLAHDGSLVVIASGLGNKPPPGRERPPDKAARDGLPLWVCRSHDNGKSWEREETVALPDGKPWVTPFGDIERSPDGTLATSVYWESWESDEKSTAYFLRSRDDGHTWGEGVIIGRDDYNETDILCLDEHHWLAACRTRKDQHLDLFVSEDSGKNWTLRGPLTLPMQHPAHLLQLSDGRILLVYGSRMPGECAVCARISTDKGTSWDAPIVLADLEDTFDSGYPSSVQIQDGTIITAYYCKGVSTHMRYHMGVVRWQA